MKLLDANLFLYAYHSSSVHHRAAKQWIEEAFSEAAPVCLSWQTVTAFIRISTAARVFDAPFSITQCIEIVNSWLAVPSVRMLTPGERHWEILGKLLAGAQCRGPLVMDAHLAALALEHGAALYTTDKDFTRFEGLRIVNPLRRQIRGA